MDLDSSAETNSNGPPVDQQIGRFLPLNLEVEILKNLPPKYQLNDP